MRVCRVWGGGELGCSGEVFRVRVSKGSSLRVRARVRVIVLRLTHVM